MHMNIQIPFAPVRTGRRTATGARGRILVVVTLAGVLPMLAATGCIQNTSSPPNSPVSQPPGKKGGGGGW
jgi:hypothetical protein